VPIADCISSTVDFSASICELFVDELGDLLRHKNVFRPIPEIHIAFEAAEPSSPGSVAGVIINQSTNQIEWKNTSQAWIYVFGVRKPFCSPFALPSSSTLELLVSRHKRI
jgi:hypothetical protein